MAAAALYFFYAGVCFTAGLSAIRAVVEVFSPIEFLLVIVPQVPDV